MFKEFDLPILFDISTTKSVDKNKLDFVADGEYDFIGRTSVDWGLQGKLHKLSFEPNPKDSFSLIQVGETVALWREREWYASQNLFLLNPKIDKIKENKLYFQGAINKEMSRYGKEYNSYPTMKSLAVTKIFLPVIENSDPDHEYTVHDIDWQYMQEHIAELERDRIAELDAYLVASGLDDYELTDEDKEILSLSTESVSDEAGAPEDDFGNGQVRFKKFALSTLFTSSTGDVDLQQKDINGKGEFFINSGMENNGIKGRTDRPARIFPANTITV
ncbi:MAG: restriction endonuclease subunit S, partial [Lachnospiraceae bacterium]|nr:restriction endonuclease subunit S [Lachnospiraceae bacterium]